MRRQSLIDLITAAGVIVSLTLVAVEIRGNTKAVNASMVQSITEQSIQVSLAAATSPELRKAYGKVLAGKEEELTLDEEDALISWYAAILRLNENRFRQRELGIFGDDVSGVAGVGSGHATRIPFFRKFWAVRKDSYPPDFRAYVDSAVIPRVVDSIPRIIRR